MGPFEVLDTSDLVNVLSEYTAKYTKLHTKEEKKKISSIEKRPSNPSLLKLK
jgi:hypothetical protein